jgi:hypothetical protein
MADEIVTREWSNVEAYLETHSTAEWVDIIESEFNHHEDRALALWKAKHSTINASEMAMQECVCMMKSSRLWPVNASSE